VGSSAINAGRPINVAKTEAGNLVCNLMVATITNTELSRFRSLALFWRSLAMNRERRHPAGDWKPKPTRVAGHIRVKTPSEPVDSRRR